MNIILINPHIHSDYPQPSLGLLSVGTSLKTKGHSVKIIDANTHFMTMPQIAAEVEVADIVGITATSLTYPAADKIARYIRKVHPYKFMVLGGIHASLFPNEVIAEGIFDAVVKGEGEKLMPIVVELQEKGVYEGNGIDIDDLPITDYTLLDGFKPRMSYGKHSEFMPMLLSRGCPYYINKKSRCAFCSNPIFGSGYKTMSVERAIDELVVMSLDYGIKEVKFYDDVFTQHKARAVELSLKIRNLVRWTCMTRVNTVDRFTLNTMKKAGCYAIAYGIESGDPDILKSISKNITLEEIEQAVRYSKEAGLKVIGYFMLGAPGETVETIRRTVDFAIKLGVDHAQFSIATALPGSEWYELVPEVMRANAYAMPWLDNPSLCELSTKQLYKELARANKRFKLGR